MTYAGNCPIGSNPINNPYTPPLVRTVRYPCQARDQYSAGSNIEDFEEARAQR